MKALKEFFGLGELFGYWFRKHDPNRPTNGTIKAMHWINKLSMFMFLICLLVILYRLFIR